MALKTINSEKLPIKLWLRDIEDGALQQARNLANLPFAFKHVAIMPDAHQGYGMPIGGVLATKGEIIPNAVGVDIGCGMCAVRTSLEEVPLGDLKAILGMIRNTVPVGFNWHKSPRDHERLPERKERDAMPIVWEQFQRAQHQLGTLGGGNHFIEVQRGSEGRIWIMIHSGSRNLGKTVADFYNKTAVRICSGRSNAVPKVWQLASLPLDSKEAFQYRNEMEYCVAFALANRKAMMEAAQEAFVEILGDVGFDPLINIAHNYAAFEKHFKADVIVHRKGATRAGKDEIGIIPGSQGTKSYIVRGKGSEESFESCSHGAGRTMGRKEARRRLDLKEQQAFLEQRNILHSLRSKGDLDEAPAAYKDIDIVMGNQADLVEIVTELTPLAVVKG